MSKYHQGKFSPQNPERYKGDPSNIIFRSSWEMRFMKWLDTNPSVLEWSSEEFYVWYRHPVSGRARRYFPDFKVKVKTKEGIEETWIVEIKPLNQTKPPEPQKKKTKKYINEVKTYAVNHYKWEAAKAWCEERDYRFMIMTEKELGIKK